jgi:phosphoglycolate phosphatase-like HAD superfamily hydrolase
LKAVEAVVFDLDGTLVRSRHDYREMSRRVEGILRDAGVLDEGLSQPRRIWQIIRRGEEGMNELGITGVDRKRIHERVTEALNTVELLALDTVEPMTGALETLRAIKELGLRIGVATRAGSPYAKRCLETTTRPENRGGHEGRKPLRQEMHRDHRP